MTVLRPAAASHNTRDTRAYGRSARRSCGANAARAALAAERPLAHYVLSTAQSAAQRAAITTQRRRR